MEIERAFAHIWALMGAPIPEPAVHMADGPEKAEGVSLRIVATLPSTAGMFRFDQLVAALARNRVWLTDAYFAGTATYVQALRSAATDGVDVRLLVPNATDVPLLRPLSRSGYRTLLESGVRVFEWNGTMLHAKTAVTDGRWARVGSTNLNIASWLGNCEMDVVVEDEAFASEMEAMYLEDLKNATEIVLDYKRRVRAPGEPPHPRQFGSSGSGSAGRAAAGAVRISNTIGAAFTDRRVLEPVEARVTLITGLIVLASAVLIAFFPHVLAYPFVVLAIWIAFALLYRAFGLYLQRRKRH
jgi:cardiolipin synthase